MDARKQLGIRQKAAITTHRVVDRQPIAPAYLIVFQAVARGCMHRTGTGLRSNMLADNDRHLAIIEWMPQRQPFQGLTPATTNDAFVTDAIALKGGR